MARCSSRWATRACARARLSSIATLAVGLDDGGALLPVLEARARLGRRPTEATRRRSARPARPAGGLAPRRRRARTPMPLRGALRLGGRVAWAGAGSFPARPWSKRERNGPAAVGRQSKLAAADHPSRAATALAFSHRAIPTMKLCGEIFVMTPQRCGKVAPRSLRTWPPDVKLSADRTHRSNSICPDCSANNSPPVPVRVGVAPSRGRILHRRLRTADNHHQELVGAHQGKRRPRSHSRTHQAMEARGADRSVSRAVGVWRAGRPSSGRRGHWRGRSRQRPGSIRLRLGRCCRW